MGQADWAELGSSLSIATLERGVSAGVTPPSGGGSYIYGWNSLDATVTGAQGMYLEPLHIWMPETLFGRNLTFTGTVGESPEMVQAVFGLMAEGKLRLDHLVSATFRPEQATEAYDWAYRKPDECCTLVFDWRA